jgi:DNA-binding transcriptional LysR family regulator
MDAILLDGLLSIQSIDDIGAIRMVNWNAFDLNLLRVLDAMLHEPNTTRVGERIGLSQPAVSAALGRLRHALGDPLFVKEGNRLVPTSFAEAVRGDLRQAFDRIERSLSGATFDPAESTRVFRMLGDDYLAELLLPKLVRILGEQAPGMRFHLLPINPHPLAAQLAEGSLDLAFAVAEPVPDWVEQALALHGAPKAVAAKGNRRLKRAGVKDRRTIPVDLFCDMPHVFFAPDGAVVGEEDAALTRIGRARRVVLTVPDFLSVARIVAQTELIGLLPDRFALSIAREFGLSVYELPFDMPLIPLHLYWHRRHTNDPEHRWLRDRILEVIVPADALRHPVSLARGKNRARSRTQKSEPAIAPPGHRR